MRAYARVRDLHPASLDEVPVPCSHADDRYSGHPRLELAGISKSFGGVAALREVDFTLRAGEIHGLVGENGAGKSTLMKIIAGVHTDYDGRMRSTGREVRFRSARDALAAGIGMVHQELRIVPDLTVAENVFLGKQPVRPAASSTGAPWCAAPRAARRASASTSTRGRAWARCRSACSS